MPSKKAVGGDRMVEVTEGDWNVERAQRDGRRMSCGLCVWRKKQETWKGQCWESRREGMSSVSDP